MGALNTIGPAIVAAAVSLPSTGVAGPFDPINQDSTLATCFSRAIAPWKGMAYAYASADGNQVVFSVPVRNEYKVGYGADEKGNNREQGVWILSGTNVPEANMAVYNRKNNILTIYNTASSKTGFVNGEFKATDKDGVVHSPAVLAEVKPEYKSGAGKLLDVPMFKNLGDCKP